MFTRKTEEASAPVKPMSTSVQNMLTSGKENHQVRVTSQKPAEGGSQGHPCGAVEGSAPEDPEELYCKQVAALERRLLTLLPNLSQETIASTACVQARLEQSMNKPAGRLQKFHMEIARIRRQFT